nr:MAG TPA: hypothetical protein [Caudoviricetes sp.]
MMLEESLTPRDFVTLLKREDNMEQEKFDLWCVVELFGHSRIAGRCTEQNVAGTNMLRVDVPDTSNQPGFTRFLSSGAIYAINPVSEGVARQIAENLQIQPVNIWDVRHLVDQKLKSLQDGESPDFDF